MIENLFEADVITVSATASIRDARLRSHERRCVRAAVPARKREFALGRWCAREALRRLGIHDYALLTGSGNEPLWPPGIVGSISHYEGYCGVAVARRTAAQAIGIDVELSQPLAPGLRRMVCRRSELDWIERSAPPPSSDWPKLVFSAKESVYKGVYSLTGRRLGFHDVEIRMIPSHHRFVASVLTNPGKTANRRYLLRGRYACTSRHIFTGVVLTSFACFA